LADNLLQELENTIRTVPDFPMEGILFRDITPILTNGLLLTEMMERIVKDIENLNWTPDVIVGPEARGFIFGPLLSTRMKNSFVPVRKPGKLPSKTIKIDYTLEYGSDSLEVHEDAISPGQKILIIDDLLATGGTVSACIELCKRMGADVIGVVFIIELEGLGARELLDDIPIHSLLKYPA
jgi:adenine phosphoribosyltransferase